MSQGPWNPLPAPPQLPFQPPQQFASPAPSKPSGFYKAVGITQAVLGAGGVLYSLFSLVMVGFSSKWSRGVYDAASTALLVAVAAVYVVTGALLLTTGIGVFKARRWSRITGVVYATLSLFDTFSNAALQLLIIQPRLAKGIAGPLGSSGGFQAIMVVSAAFGVLASSVIPVATLIVLGRPAARLELDQ